ncbi:MAG: gephyrin-like molybdotransferase Glp [Desulfococcaceae bacterium]|nr:gephyrin-like molybdotransferase Glp [Desulfococcaceae bacterium]
MSMNRNLDFGLEEALKMTLARIRPLASEDIALWESVDRVVAEDLYAKVNSPSVDASLKDGYAVISADVERASESNPVCLKQIGVTGAGDPEHMSLKAGITVRVLTGARIPEGANAVVAEEFTRKEGENIVFLNFAEPGRNILPKGCDVALGKCIIRKGQKLTPGLVGFLAAAGYERVALSRVPGVAILATGDEVVAPGKPLPEGKLYASNITTLAAWCRRFAMPVDMRIVKDSAAEIRQAMESMLKDSDALITSGGAWTGDRDLVAAILSELGWQQVFHRIRIGPGKAVGFGILKGKPVFVLPGGPPSNLMGFLQIALPGLLKLAGYSDPGLPLIYARTAENLSGKYADWTQFIFGKLDMRHELPVFHSLRGASRLKSMADAEAVAAVPEGETFIPAGSVIRVQLLK